MFRRYRMKIIKQFKYENTIVAAFVLKDNLMQYKYANEKERGERIVYTIKHHSLSKKNRDL